MSLLLRDVRIGDRRRDILIEGNRIASLDGGKAERVVEGGRKIAIPGLVNTHTHAAMALLRGYAEDMELTDWLSTRIWPREATLKPEDIYWGTKLACLEMIRTGTTTFNDMYFHMDEAARAVEEMGLRAVLSEGYIDLGKKDAPEVVLKHTREINRRIAERRCDRIRVAWGPHAVYTAGEEGLRAITEEARSTGALVHIHVSETRKEVEDCRKTHGMTPVGYLESLGALHDHVVAAHGCWLTPADAEILARRGVSVSHNPVSNMKLASGALDLPLLTAAGVNVALGTDGCASNNSLDMFETMKIAALLQKHVRGSATAVTAGRVLQMATAAGARALHLDAGEIAVGKLADLVLVDPRSPGMVPLHDVTANLVYSAATARVDTVLCDGRVLMEGGRVPGEEEILEKAATVAADVAGR